jgi:chaperonin GroEL
MQAIAGGGNPVLVKRGVDLAVGRLTEHLQTVARPVVDESDYARVAAISANDDEAVGAVLAKALHAVGDTGTVTVEESPVLGMSVEFVEGFEFDNGYVSPYLVTNPAALEAVLENPYILLSSEKITKVQQLMPVLEKVMRDPHPLLIVAENIEGPALSMIVHNHVNGIFPCVAVRAPGFGDRRLRKLEDIATITGGEVHGKTSSFALEGMTPDQLGRAAKVRVTAERTAIIGGHGSPDAIDFRISQLRAERERATFGIDEDVLTERIGALSGKVAVIRVGAPTNAELAELQHRVEDALGATRAAMAEGIVAGGGSPCCTRRRSWTSSTCPTTTRWACRSSGGRCPSPHTSSRRTPATAGQDVVDKLVGMGPGRGASTRCRAGTGTCRDGHHRSRSGCAGRRCRTARRWPGCC